MSSLGTRDTAVTRRVTFVTSSVSRIRLRERDLVTRELHDGSEGSRDEDTLLLEAALGNTESEASDVIFVLLGLDDEVLEVAGVLGGASLITSSLFSPAP